MKIIAYGLKEQLGIWTYTDFMLQSKAKIIDYKTRGNLIEYVIYEVEEININYIKEHGITYEIQEDQD